MAEAAAEAAAAAAASESEKSKAASSYRYWVRQAQEDAAPPPIPRKLTPDELLPAQSQSANLGSAWNRAGTWEEKNLNGWASDRIKVLLLSVGSLEFPSGKAELTEVSKCAGDAFLVTVRNRKRVGYTYELTLKFKGEWDIREEKKIVNGHLEILEFSFGELDDLQMEVRLGEVKDILHQDKARITDDVRMFLQPLRAKLLQFEQELKDR